MRDLPLIALRALAAVYEAGGVRAAARRLQVTHSAVSRHLHELETSLDVALVEPAARPGRLVFTPTGEALGRSALQHLTELNRAVAAVKERRGGNSVTISTTASFAARWLLPRLAALGRTFPRIEVSVLIDQKLTDPKEQGADLSVRMGRGPWPDLRCERLMDDALYPVVSPAYWRGIRHPGSIERLARLRLLHDRDPQAAWVQWRTAHGPPDLDVRSGPRFASSDLVLRAAAEGLGVALARDRLVKHDLAAGALLRLFGELQVRIADAYWIVRPATDPDRAAVDQVLAWLRSAAPS
jgi:LysR family glycine cleavage system transcriptional activator